jgi:photosystem II stability/assembly factor-like uncharacterized protein
MNSSIVTTEICKCSKFQKLAGFIIICFVALFAVLTPQHSAIAQAPTEPVPPPKPILKAVPGDGKVFLYWDENAEKHFDAYMSSIGRNPNNFQGYKVYRATDPNFIDALRITDNLGNPNRLAPEVQFDLPNEITGYHPASIGGTRYFLGTDTGLQRTWLDEGLINGRTYYYAVVAYTFGDAIPDFPLPFDPQRTFLPNEIYTYPPLESEIDITVHSDGSVTTGVNTQKVVPKKRAIGSVDPVNPTVDRVSGTAGGDIIVDITDPSELVAGANYSISFEDTVIITDDDVMLPVTKNFSLYNNTTGRYVFEKHEDFSSLPLPIREGFQLSIVSAGDTVQANPDLTKWQTNRTDQLHSIDFGISTRYPKLADYRVEIEEQGVSRSIEFSRTRAGITITFPAQDVNFRVYNETTGQEIPFAFSANVPRNLRSVQFLNDAVGYTAGDAGVVQKTIDGGQNWTPLQTGLPTNFLALYFINENTGFVVGIDGVILKTEDGGSSWGQMDSNTIQDLTDVVFVSEQKGFITSWNGEILRTTDGGETWSAFRVSNSRLLSITFITSDIGFAAGFRHIFKTTDGGDSWVEVLNVARVFNDIYFINENIGFVVGNAGRMQRTTDGGTTWEEILPGTTSNLFGIGFTDEQNGILISQNGLLFRTSDSGLTWIDDSSQADFDLFDLFIRGSNIWIVGRNNIRMRSNDSGVSFSTSPFINRFRSSILPNGNPIRDEIIFVEDFGAQTNVDTWRVRMNPDLRGTSSDPQPGDILKLVSIKPYTSADEFTFSIGADNVLSVDPELIKNQMEQIRVVPNPYLVSHLAEPNLPHGHSRQLHFTNLPTQCTIRIFTVSGRLVQTLNVNNSIDNDRYIWDMMTSSNDELPYGIYIYHVSAPGVGEKVGKFAVIK